MRWGRWLVAALGVWGCGGPVCDGDTLQASLDAASAGDVVEANACRYEAAVTVPAGVTLRGRPETVLAGAGSGAAVTLEDGASLVAIAIEVERGRGVSARDAASVRIEDVTITGPVDEASANSVPPMPSGADTATHGLVLLAVGTETAPATLSNLEVRGFGRIGVYLEDSHVAWEGGAASENLGTGLMASGGSVALTDVEICTTWRGIQPFAYGAVFSDGVDVTSTGLVLCENEGPGALHDDASVTHVGLAGAGNREAALWVQRGRALEVTGATLEENALAGLVLVMTPTATVRDSRVEGTREVTRVEEERGEVRTGDGVHAILADAAGLRLEGVTLHGNERAGLLLQVDDGVVPASALSGVVAEAEGDALGAVAQTPTGVLSPDTWSAGIERRGAATTNDALVVDPLMVLGAVAPMFFPPAEP